MNTNEQQELAYAYEGPPALHAHIGQVMAYLGYSGGHEPRPLGAAVTLQAAGTQQRLDVTFYQQGQEWHTHAYILAGADLKQTSKELLLHWYDRCFGQGQRNPWGTLMGVRPTKLVHHLRDQGLSAPAIEETLVRHYHVTPAIAQELLAMTALQRPFIERPRREAALYIGIPYCPSHCLYCSFPSRLCQTETAAGLLAFAAAVEEDIRDIDSLCRQYGLRVTSAYIGGGTPTCLPKDALARILQAVAVSFPDLSEWTVEAGRPDTADVATLALLREYGVDRISVNPQTMQQRLLDLLGRRHSVADVYTMYENCRRLGFSVVNMDFIAGLPGQTAADMQENMEIVCQLHPENVTIHTLALKKKAPLFHHPLRQAIPPAGEVAASLSRSRQLLAQAGYIPYYMYRQKYMAASFANIGYALPQTESQYNIQMMEERQTILAAGPGSTTKFLASDGHSLEKVYMPKDPDTYRQLLNQRMAQRRRICAMIYGGDDT